MLRAAQLPARVKQAMRGKLESLVDRFGADAQRTGSLDAGLGPLEIRRLPDGTLRILVD